jgi:hypothetical protein
MIAAFFQPMLPMHSWPLIRGRLDFKDLSCALSFTICSTISALRPLFKLISDVHNSVFSTFLLQVRFVRNHCFGAV